MDRHASTQLAQTYGYRHDGLMRGYSMATLGQYCKAYPLKQLSAYSAWRSGQGVSDTGTGENDHGDIVFLQENYTVTRDIFLDEDVIFSDVTPEWVAFCREQLAFAPDSMNNQKT